MTKEFVADPDLQFTRDLIEAGAGDVKKCYQCATCSVACPISPDNEPYPRKEMIWAQWGLKDRLLYDPDVWLCHHCNDCSTQCPRGANPGDLMKAVRKMTIEENAWPSFMGHLVGSSSTAPFVLGVPAIVVLFLWIINQSGFGFPQDGIVHYGKFISYLHIQIVYTLALLFAVFAMYKSLKNYWRNLETNNPIEVMSARRSLISCLYESFREILPHETFKDCQANNSRYTSHLMVFWGMIGLFVTTAIVAFMIDILHLDPPSRGGPGTIPIKILGNLSAASFVIGLGIMLVRRFNEPEQAGNSSYFDWLFLFMIFGTGLTGWLTELIRAIGLVSGAYTFYAIHLMFILALFLYLPFSKFAHLGYRTAAIAWSKASGRSQKFEVVPKFAPPPASE